MIESQQLAKLIELENLLNEYSGKRYHFQMNTDWDRPRYAIVEIIKLGKEKTIIKDLTLDQLYAFIKRNIKITLEQKKLWAIP